MSALLFVFAYIAANVGGIALVSRYRPHGRERFSSWQEWWRS